MLCIYEYIFPVNNKSKLFKIYKILIIVQIQKSMSVYIIYMLFILFCSWYYINISHTKLYKKIITILHNVSILEK